MAVFYCIWALLLLVPQLAAAHARQAPAAAAPAAAAQAARGTAATPMRAFTIFLRGTPVGREELTMRADATGTTSSRSTRIAAAVQRGDPPRRSALRPRLDAGVARCSTPASTWPTSRCAPPSPTGRSSREGSDGGKPIASTTPLAPQTFILPNTFFFSAHDVLGRRFASAGTTRRVPRLHRARRRPAVPGAQRQQPTACRPARCCSTCGATSWPSSAPAARPCVYLTTAEDGGLIRLSVPAQGLEVVREDAATSTARTQLHSNPGDEAAR